MDPGRTWPNGRLYDGRGIGAADAIHPVVSRHRAGLHAAGGCHRNIRHDPESPCAGSNCIGAGFFQSHNGRTVVRHAFRETAVARETTELVQQILAGAKTSYAGDTIRSHNFRLGLKPASHIPIYLAGLRPKMLELAGEKADGVILNLVPQEVLPRVLEHIDNGAKRSGRRVEDLTIALYIYTFVTADQETARKEMAAIAAGYFSTPVYNNFLKWMGYEHEAQQILEGFRQRDRSMTLGAFTDEVLEKLAVIGDAGTCRARIADYAKAGISIPVITPAAADPQVFEATMVAFERDV